MLMTDCRMNQITDFHKASSQVEGQIENRKTLLLKEKLCLEEVYRLQLVRKTLTRVDEILQYRELRQQHLDRRYQLNNFRTI